MHAPELGGADEEVEGEGGGMVGLMMEGEPVAGRHAMKPGGGARAGGAVEEAGAAGTTTTTTNYARILHNNNNNNELPAFTGPRY